MLYHIHTGGIIVHVMFKVLGSTKPGLACTEPTVMCVSYIPQPQTAMPLYSYLEYLQVLT